MKYLITQDEYENHDCKMSEDDGCKTCSDWIDQSYYPVEKLVYELR